MAGSGMHKASRLGGIPLNLGSPRTGRGNARRTWQPWDTKEGSPIQDQAERAGEAWGLSSWVSLLVLELGPDLAARQSLLEVSW